uniref:Zinc finger FYVE domain containing protein n=1 Tax=Linum usitatissimum TaxID=4006 RepID=A0A165G0F5_LINUS|nr:zinc finger FYVE domain containing protein [Linum usitatissimum]
MTPGYVASFLLTNVWLHAVVFLQEHHLSFAAANPRQQVPCYFIFGDSLADNGNNNQLPSFARANYPPYGIDFPTVPTGRFSNGKTIVDVIAELLGFNGYYILPYNIAINEDQDNKSILKGVNYASGAAGIRDETGRHLGARVSFSCQVSNYQDTVSKIIDLLGGDDVAAAKHLSKCIYSIGLGSNDYLNNYFMPLFYSTALEFTPEEYADDFIRIYTNQLQIMYKYGARKFVLYGLGPIGCSPSSLIENGVDRSTCINRINFANQIFNHKLQSLVDRLNQYHNMSDAKFIFINSYGIFMELIDNPVAHEFEETREACCGVGKNNGQITCLPFQNPCENRIRYLFWDAFHPTEAANVIIGRKSYNSRSPSDSYPFDIRRLSQL